MSLLSTAKITTNSIQDIKDNDQKAAIALASQVKVRVKNQEIQPRARWFLKNTIPS